MRMTGGTCGKARRPAILANCGRRALTISVADGRSLRGFSLTFMRPALAVEFGPPAPTLEVKPSMWGFAKSTSAAFC